MKEKLKNLYRRFIEKIGMDKVAHFSVGGFVVALCAMFGIVPAAIGFVLVMIAEILKEEFIDETLDIKDILATLIGEFIPLIIAIILCCI